MEQRTSVIQTCPLLHLVVGRVSRRVIKKLRMRPGRLVEMERGVAHAVYELEARQNFDQIRGKAAIYQFRQFTVGPLCEFPDIEIIYFVKGIS